MNEPEIKTFSEFYRHRQQCGEKFVCPICEKPIVGRFVLTFNMNQFGKAEFSCTQPTCEFNKMAFTIEAIPEANPASWRKP